VGFGGGLGFGADWIAVAATGAAEALVVVAAVGTVTTIAAARITPPTRPVAALKLSGISLSFPFARIISLSFPFAGIVESHASDNSHRSTGVGGRLFLSRFPGYRLSVTVCLPLPPTLPGVWSEVKDIKHIN
jgi:hypothetical protein